MPPVLRSPYLAVCLLIAALIVARPPVAAAAATGRAAAADAALDEPTFSFQIPGGSLDAALVAFTNITGWSVKVASDARLDGLVSPGVTGVHTAQSALALLLQGTGLTARLSGFHVVALDVQGIAERVEVTGRVGYQADATETATRTYGPLRDVPQAVTVVTRSTIADQSMQSMGDVLRYVPGIGVAQGEGNRDTAVFRGTSSTSDFYVDGLKDDVQYFRDLYNVERVEALKGPNAMIFGRGGAGGVVNRATRQADWTRTREATLQAGSFENRRATFDVGDRVGDASSARTTAVYENSGSYRDGVSLERYGINPTVAFVPVPGTIKRAGYE